MAKATNGREKSMQQVMLRQAAEGRMGTFKNMPTQMQKDLKANKALYDLAVKNGVVSSPKRSATKTTKK